MLVRHKNSAISLLKVMKTPSKYLMTLVGIQNDVDKIFYIKKCI